MSATDGPTVFESVSALTGAVGTLLGPSQWMPVEQERITAFAKATGDEQWIHVDEVRAASGPFGGTIAHGYLTLSLLAPLLPDLIEVHGATMFINYGLGRVRFIQPVRSGSSIRATGEIIAADEDDRGVLVTVRLTIEIEGETKPAMVADGLTLYVP